VKRALTIVLLVALAAVLLRAVAELPQYGSPDSPAYTHVGSYYLEHGPDEAGADNIVTGIILNYRGFDTNGEVTVIVTALIAVFAVLLSADEKAVELTKPAHQRSRVSSCASSYVCSRRSSSCSPST